MKKTTFFLIFTIIASFTSCNNNSNIKSNEIKEIKFLKLEKASWLIGKWQNNSDEGILQENWEKKNDSTLIGASFFVVVKDTTFLESILIEERGNELSYIPTVKNQNDGKPIIFTLTSLNNNQLVFENPSHDFPQKIIYKQVTSDSLVATISGVVKGKEKTQSFPMVRAK